MAHGSSRRATRTLHVSIVANRGIVHEDGILAMPLSYADQKRGGMIDEGAVSQGHGVEVYLAT